MGGLQDLKFSKSLLSVWDNSLVTATDVQTRQLSVGQDMTLLMEENKVSLLNRARSRGQLAVLYARRGLSLVIYMAIQLAAWLSIVYLTARSQRLEDEVTTTLQHSPKYRFLGGLSATIGVSIVPAVVSIINSVMPNVIKNLTNFEKWDGARDAVKQLVFR